MNLIFGIKTLDINEFIKKFELFINLVPEIERDKYFKYKNTHNLQLSLIGHILVRYVLTSIYNIDLTKYHFKKNNHGKPFFENLPVYFNLSHSGKWVVACFSHLDVGIDIERIREPNFKVVNRFFSEKERNIIDNEKNEIIKKELFFKIWTAKEAYVKMLGHGITYTFSNFTIEISKKKYEIYDPFQKNKVYLKNFHFDYEYILTCCSFEKHFEKKVNIISTEELIKTGVIK